SPLPGTRLYKTGDQGRYGHDGNIGFLGRADQQAKIRGFRIELGEIEALLGSHSAVQEAVVLVRSDHGSDKRLVAYVVPRTAQPLSAGTLRAWLQERVPNYMTPSAWVLLERLPLTPNGKVDRTALPAPDSSLADNESDYLPPRGHLEFELVQIWEDLSPGRRIGIQDDFFTDLGGHSLLAVRLVAKISKRFGRSLSLSSIFQGATIERLSGILRDEAILEQSSSIVALKPNGAKPPLFFVHPVGGNVFNYLELARCLDAGQPFYAFEAPGLDGKQPPCSTIEDLASRYIEELRRMQQAGPYWLGGWSFGGLVAYEMARQLKDQGHSIGALLLIDTFPFAQDQSFAADNTAVLFQFISDLCGQFAKAVPFSAADLCNLNEDEKMSF